MTTTRYLTAEQWGMRWARPPVWEALGDPEAYIHHVGGTAWMDGDAAEIFRQLNEYAINGKGYSALDYDVLVHYDRKADVLTFGEGRGPWRSAATLDRNDQGEAVVLCGNTHLREPLDIELEGIALGVAAGIKEGWIAPDCKILGHRDNPAHPNATACPGQFLYPKLPVIRARVTELLSPATTPHPAPDPDEEDEMSAAVMYVGRSDSGAHKGSILKSLNMVVASVVPPGGEGALDNLIRQGLVIAINPQNGERLTCLDDAPDLGGAWVVQMGTVVG